MYKRVRVVLILEISNRSRLVEKVRFLCVFFLFSRERKFIKKNKQTRELKHLDDFCFKRIMYRVVLGFSVFFFRSVDDFV